MSAFVVPHNCTTTPWAAIIHDIVWCRGGLYVCLIGPWYSRVGLANASIYIDGVQTDWWFDEDPEFFTLATYATVPPASRLNSSITVELRKQQRIIATQVLTRYAEHTGTLAFATLAKDDHTWIAEWIDHHVQLGVEHFYIYNNGDTALSTELTGYKPATVTEIDWRHPYGNQPWNHVPFLEPSSHLWTQPAHMLHAALQFGDHWTWMGFLDTDEFLVPSCPLSEVLAVPNLIAERPGGRVTCLRLQGKWFGNSRHHEVQAGNIRRNYTCCEHGYTSSTKCLIRPEAAHSSRIHLWNTDGDTLNVNPELLHFNHYRGMSDKRRNLGERADGHYSNETVDPRILQWVG